MLPPIAAAVVVVVIVFGNPNAMMSPPLLDRIPFGIPVVTKSNPWPIDGQPITTGAPTLNSQRLLPVSLSNATIIPDGFNGVFTGVTSSLNK